jgi:hypothetical protein
MKNIYINNLKMKFKVLIRNKIILIMFFIITTTIISSCEKTEKSDSYYVKYEVNSSSVYIGGNLNITVSEKDGRKAFLVNTRKNWETIIGPVEKGFNAFLEVSKSGSSDNTLKLYTQISVSINNEPFVIKKIDDKDIYRNSTTISYSVGN